MKVLPRGSSYTLEPSLGVRCEKPRVSLGKLGLNIPFIYYYIVHS